MLLACKVIGRIGGRAANPLLIESQQKNEHLFIDQARNQQSYPFGFCLPESPQIGGQAPVQTECGVRLWNKLQNQEQVLINF